MERLTERTSGGILVKEDYGEDVLKTLYQCYGAEPTAHYANCDEGYCAVDKLAEYEDLEEQGKLLKLPCALGDTVYATFGGKVSEQIVRGILFRENKIWAQDGNGSILGEFGEDVFFTWEEAEAALKEL